MTLDELLREMVTRRASDVHLQAGSPPMGRIDGQLVPFGTQPLMPPDTQMLAQALMTADQWDDFTYRNELDLAYSVSGLGRFRCNVFRQRGAVGMVMRIVSDAIPGFDALGLPADVLRQLADAPRGLILVTGPTGSGKTTTLASLIDHINRSFAYNIITVEDPIEILHKNKKSIVVQREIGSDTRDFRTALKYAMRQDPDVIMIGEMRDKETVEAALSAAQTGHLVLSTLHTQDAVRSVNRIIDFFPPYERDQVRLQLAESLVGIISQRLLRRADGVGRVLGLEIMMNTPLIQEYVKDEDKTHLIKDALIEDNIRGMHTFDQHLSQLYRNTLITMDEALAAATSPHELKLMLTRSGVAY
ncbi:MULTISPECIES: type IV pilus twitching motility protein PilT [unclassified Deinococcus]|uniref:type IV pilus twitching motility protein PilT n=1 Tax=unclassified Deinococcus TaxID=2623546 RepID=UPI000992EB02|nr:MULTISPECIES: type IV pilus twitching motility protein PilT [unclassified Deinococcus]MBX8464929.1 type IV pilus twitching motility protein PilT [Deinococcus sp. RIT780]MCD0157227.1 type IV pilus twitching motility protein PilT [Deinococcus sp. 6GRE01]MCD0161312.1 type IV pilus twitching motility protein PilT [Deinococcus sp. 6YEL10]MCD0165057.1 type IV pilus twitching motility protein PilT [Deinococcus sp. 12RED42]MCD0169411.1 type IV pilus twitching motility protein PilT [Deinococcus sp. 